MFVAEPQLEGERGRAVVGLKHVVEPVAVNGDCVTATVAALVTDSSLPSSSVKETVTLIDLAHVRRCNKDVAAARGAADVGTSAASHW